MIFDKKIKREEDIENIDDSYVRSKALHTSEEDISEVIDNEETLNQKITQKGALKKYAELAKLMLGMLKDYRKGIYREVPWFTIASIGFALLYIINPLDIIPDFIPGLGYIDDLSVLTIALRFVETDLHNYLDWKLEDDNEENA